MTELEKTKNYLLTREYMDEIADVLSEEFDNFNRDNLKVSLNEGADSKDDPELVRQELMYINILSMLRVIERGYTFPPDKYVLS